jgi:S-(hydroxymethyl)glutathione dehydrogenase/alcohol dehydrogenase
LPEYVEKYLEGKFSVDSFATHSFQMDNINEAFHVMERGESLRGVVSISN